MYMCIKKAVYFKIMVIIELQPSKKSQYLIWYSNSIAIK